MPERPDGFLNHTRNKALKSHVVNRFRRWRMNTFIGKVQEVTIEKSHREFGLVWLRTRLILISPLIRYLTRCLI